MVFEWEGECCQPRNAVVRFELEIMHTRASTEAKKNVAMLVIRQPNIRAKHTDSEAGGSGFKPPLCKFASCGILAVGETCPVCIKFGMSTSVPPSVFSIPPA